MSALQTRDIELARRNTYRSNKTRAVRTDQARLALGLEHIRNANHVVLRDTLGDTHGKRNLSRNGLLNTRGSKRRRDKNRRGSCTSFLYSICHGSKHWLAQVLLARLLWIRSTDDIGTVVNGLLRVKSTLATCESLEDDLCIRVNSEVVVGVGVGLGRGGVGTLLCCTAQS